MRRLEGKVAIITGGSSGIGEATVRLFLEEGAKVLLFARNEERSYKIIQDFQKDVQFYQGDVTIENDIKNAVDTTVEKWGKLDCIFNNAGIIGPRGAIDTISEEGVDNALDVNIKGVFYGIKHAARVMKPQRYGSIINCSSVAGLDVTPDETIYATSKAAVNHLTRYTASELGEYGIRVNSVCPGAIITRMWYGGYDVPGDLERDLLDYIVSVQPLKQAGYPIDVAKAVLWLASDDSRFVTGQPIVIDGGASIGWPRFAIHKVEEAFSEIYGRYRQG
jgi:NAD(P)-dependent dehydrogenase (short-subunit alcohol dehydrogenase family)